MKIAVTTIDVPVDINIQRLFQSLTEGLQPESSPSHHTDADGEVCLANISPREWRKRLIAGIIPFAVALAILAWQLAADIDRLWRLPLFFLFVAAASGYFQWRDKT